MPDAQANFAISTVATAPAPATSGTSLVVQSGHGARFPTAPFNASVWPAGLTPDPTNAEIVRVTAVSTDTFTITRAQESTTARVIITGDVIAATLTAKTFTDLASVYAGLAATAPSIRTATNIVGWAGDSITNGSGASAANKTFRSLAFVYAGGLKISAASYNGGVAGDTSAQLLARMPTVIANSTGPIHVLVGTNDAGAAVSYATYQANVKAIKAAADAAGRPISFSTVPPRASAAGSTIRDRTGLYNVFLRTWCQQNAIPVADVYAALVDPTTGYLAAANDSGDGIHPSDAGHALIASTIYPVVAAQVASISWPVRSINEGGLVADPLMATTYGNIGWLSGFNASASFSNVAASGGDLPAGQWKRITFPGGGGGLTSVLGIPISSGWSVGDTLAFFGYFRGGSSGALNKVGVANNSGSYSSVNIDQPGTGSPGPIAFTYTVPGGTTEVNFAFNIQAGASATVTVDVGAADVFNLTTGGIALSL